MTDGERDSINEPDGEGVVVDDELGEFVPVMVREARPDEENIVDADVVSDERADRDPDGVLLCTRVAVTIFVTVTTGVAESRREKEALEDDDGEPVGEMVSELNLDGEFVAETVDVFALVPELDAEIVSEKADEDEADRDAILADADVDGEMVPSIVRVIVTAWVNV